MGKYILKYQDFQTWIINKNFDSNITAYNIFFIIGIFIDSLKKEACSLIYKG